MKKILKVFIIFFILVFIGLGTWQIIRLNWKNNLILEIENSLKNPPVELAQSNKENFLKIKTSGSIDFDKQIYLYNLNESGTPGFEVINPITIRDENFLINRGSASATDIENLGKSIVEKVYAKFNVKLEWEVKIIGE